MITEKVRRVLDAVYLGNSLETYLHVLAMILGIAIVLLVIEKVLLVRLKALAGRTKNKFDDYLVELVGRLGIPTYAFIGLYIASRSLVLTPSIDRLLSITFVIFLTVKFIQIIQHAAIFLIAQAYGRVGGADPNRAAVVRNLGLVVRIALWGIGIVFVLDNLGIRVTGVVAGLGIGGIAVALAAQAILEDAFSSFSIFLDRPFEVGDFIIVDDLMGVVKNVGFKTTRIRSLGGEELIFANKDLTNSRIQNYKRMQERRIAFTLGVVYQTPRETMKRIPDMIRAIVEGVEGARFDRAHFKSYGASSLDIETVFYVQSPDYNTFMDIQQAINFAIMEAFEREGIEFAYPTRTLFIEKQAEQDQARM
ncbi:MAG: mechanosensitive ion channel family protein [Myxococcota bacterium]